MAKRGKGDHEWPSVTRRRFVRQSAEVAAASLFGLGALDGVIDSVVQRLDERSRLGALGHQVAEVLQQSDPAWAAAAYYVTYLYVSDPKKIMTGAISNANHRTTVTATIKPAAAGVGVTFTVEDNTSGQTAATVDGQASVTKNTDSAGKASVVLLSSNTPVTGESVTVKAKVAAGDGSDEHSATVPILIPDWEIVLPE